MSKRETDKDREVLPMPITLTPEQAKQIAAGTGTVLPAFGITILKGIPLGTDRSRLVSNSADKPCSR